MSDKNSGGYWRRLADALFNRRPCESEEAGRGAANPAPLSDTEMASHMAGCEMEIREKGQQIEQVRRDYEELRLASARHVAEAGDRALEELFRRLINPLGQLARFEALLRQGRTLDPGDVLTIGSDIERELTRAGLERDGETGQSVPFDASFHQRLSGSAPRESTVVTVVTPGYRFKGKTLIKATVTTPNKA